MRFSSRFVLLLALMGVLAAACHGAQPSSAVPTPRVDDRALQLRRLRTAVDAVADAQAAADAEVFRVLDLVRAVDSAVPGMLDPATIDQSIAAWKSSGATIDVSEQAPDLRAAYLAVASEVDDARTALATARGRLQDPWERRYLAAEDRVLTTVRKYAEAGDRLAQILGRNFDSYAWFHAEMQSFVERRWQFRSEQEAADAFFVETDTHLSGLERAQQQLTDVRTGREQAASEVNQASTDAAAVWEQRPSDAPSGSDGSDRSSP